MSELPYMPSHVSDEIADTEHLTNEELGAFRRLIRAMWRAGGLLPDDDKLLARYSRAGTRWGAISPAIMAMMTVAGGKVSNPALMMMLTLTRERRRAAVERGEAGALARWGRKVDNSPKSVDNSPKSVEKSVFRSAAKLKTGTALNSSKSLKTNDGAMLEALPKHCLSNGNHNQNQYSSALVSASKRTSEEGLHETLYEQGTELLMHRVGKTALAARAQISRWLNQVGGDAEALATVLAGADGFNLQGAPFVAVVDTRVAAIETERNKGFALPFRPHKASEANG